MNRSMERMLWLLLFWSFSSVFCSESAALTGEEAAKDSRQNLLAIRDRSVLLFPEFTDVSFMTFSQVMDILELYHDPQEAYLASVAPNYLIQVIVDNFIQGHLRDPSMENIKHFRKKGAKYPWYNRYVLSHLENDLRIVRHLGFDGGVKILSKSMELIQNAINRYYTSRSAIASLQSAVDNLEEFFFFFLKKLTPPYQYATNDIRYSAGDERDHEMAYYTGIVSVLSPARLVAVDAKLILKAITYRFRPWLSEDTMFRICNVLRGLSCNIVYKSLRLLMTHLVCIGKKEAFCDSNQMSRRYSVLNNSLFTGIKTTDLAEKKERINAILYVQVCPVLRALTLLDSAQEASAYLIAYSVCSNIRTFASSPASAFHRVLDHMIADTKFISKASKNSTLAASIFSLLEYILAWSRVDALEIAIKRNLLNLSEAFFLFSDILDRGRASTLISAAINNLRRTDSVELIVMVAAYCNCIDAGGFELISESIDVPPKINPELLKDADFVFKYNLYVLGQTLLKQAAIFIRSFGADSIESRTIIARLENERIPFPCPVEIIDSLFPKLYEYDPRQKASNEYNLYPHYSLLNLAQFLLFRMFRISFSASRFTEDGRDIPEWGHVIGFLNFMIERAGVLNGILSDLVKFYDPIDEELKALHLDASEYAIQYRARSENYYENMERNRLVGEYVFV